VLAAAAAGAYKKAATNPMAKKCALVAKAIADADLADAVKKMLVDTLENSLGIAADERHQLQTSLVEMAGTTLDGIHESLQKALADAHTKVDGAEADKTVRENAVAEAQASLSAKSAAIAEREEALTAATVAVDEADKALRAAEAAQVSGDAELGVISLDKRTMDEFLTSMRGSLKDAAASAAELKQLSMVAKKAGCEETLLISVSTALTEMPAQRGAFSKMAVDQFEDHLSKSIGELATKIADGESASAQRAAAVQAAKAMQDSATEKKTASTTDLTEAKAAQKEATAALKEAKAALKNFEPEKQQAIQNLEDITQKLNDFTERPLAVYRELRDRKTSPSPMPEREVTETSPRPAPEPEVSPAAETAGCD